MKRIFSLRNLVIFSGLLAVAGIALAFWLPRYLVNQATQAPSEESFVSHAISTENIQIQSDPLPADSQAVEQGAMSLSTETTAQNPTQTDLQAQFQNENSEPAPDSLAPEQTPLNAPESPSPAQAQAEHHSNDTRRAVATRPQSERTGGAARPNERPQYREQPTPAVPEANKRVQIQISESQISGLIYGGLARGTAPQYRKSIQGVSTRISGGRARVTVALLPRYLPDEMLNRLPGISRDTPTVYVGGTARLGISNGQLVPNIEGIQLGNVSLPAPFIQKSAAAGFRAYSRQLLTTSEGRPVHAESVQLDSGQITVVGRPL